MKLSASIILQNQANQCQFSVETNLDDSAEISEIQAKAHNAITALTVSINEAMNIQKLQSIQADHIPNKPPYTPMKKSVKNPEAPATPGQRKYLNDLLSKSGMSLKQWCSQNGKTEKDITVADCQDWIPILQKCSKTF